MKAACLQENLKAGLEIVGRAVAGQNATLPILTHVGIRTDGSRLVLSASDLEVGIECQIVANVEDEGSAAVPGRTLTELVKSLSPDRVDLQVNGKFALGVGCGNSKATLKGMDPDEAPVLEDAPDEGRVVVDGEMFVEAVKQVAFCASRDESRAVLTGVLLSCEDGLLTMAAADGFRLAVKRFTVGGNGKTSAIVPARALKEAGKIAPDGEDVRVTLGERKAWFEMDGRRLISQVIDAQFPDYGQMIPTAWLTRVIVNTASLCRLLETANVFARDGAYIVRLTVGERTLAVSAASAETGDAWGEMDAEVEGEALEIAFNITWLLEIVKAVNCPQIAFELNGPAQSGKIVPLDGEGLVYVLMPMHLG